MSGSRKRAALCTLSAVVRWRRRSAFTSWRRSITNGWCTTACCGECGPGARRTAAGRERRRDDLCATVVGPGFAGACPGLDPAAQPGLRLTLYGCFEELRRVGKIAVARDVERGFAAIVLE